MAQIDALEEYLTQTIENEQEIQMRRIEQSIEAKEKEVSSLVEFIDRQVKLSIER